LEGGKRERELHTHTKNGAYVHASTMGSHGLLLTRASSYPYRNSRAVDFRMKKLRFRFLSPGELMIVDLL
jgi:hypothetical protein